MPPPSGLQLLQVEEEDDDDDMQLSVEDVGPDCHKTESKWCEMCEDGAEDLPTKLVSAKWIKHKTHTGRNSIMFYKTENGRRQWVKLVKQQQGFMSNALIKANLLQMRSCYAALKRRAPKAVIDVISFSLCRHGDSLLIAVRMADAGIVNQKMPEVTPQDIEDAASRIADSRLFSHDVVTETFKVNTGNIAFVQELNDAGVRTLNMRFLDVDDTQNFFFVKDAISHVALKRAWTWVAHKCLQRDVPNISWSEITAIKQNAEYICTQSRTDSPSTVMIS